MLRNENRVSAPLAAERGGGQSRRAATILAAVSMSDWGSLQGMTAADARCMLKRRLKDAELPTHYSPHSFRVMGVTCLLSQGISLEQVQILAGHTDPRTTRLYDRREQKVTRNLVERISV